MPEIPETPLGVHPLGETVKPRTRWSSTCGLEAKGRRSTLSISSVKRPVRSVASAPLVGCRLAFLCRRSISDDRAEADFSGIGGRDGPRGAVTTPLAARAAPRIMETQGLFDRPALLMAWQCCCDGGSCSDRYASKGSNMNATGHPTRYRPEYREPADECAAPTTGSVLLFSDPLYRCERIILPGVPALGA